ncbi:MAG: phosphopantetheine-binding protein [Akkermansiaceae bacterium]|jgi:acyl carrier protein|nr:phosphopantetheine-binding protein [Luteolibacter sp.]
MIQDLVTSLRTLIHEQLFPLDDSVTESSDLHAAGLDSLALMQLILLVENEYSVKITPGDLDRENFSSLEKLAEMIARKKI